MSDRLFSLKMRASRAERHISGAEKILPERELPAFLTALLDRAMHHANGEPDAVHFKVEALPPETIRRVPALPVRTITAATPEEGLREMERLLASQGIARADEIVEMLRRTHGMRGAILLDADTLERLESDHERGVRATRMDVAAAGPRDPVSRKDHYAEAIVLAAKVAHAPGIAAELCISDDPDYVTGYLASAELGYVRITPLKRRGDPAGGRIFLYRGDRADLPVTVDYLEKTPVLVEGISAPPREPGPRHRKIRETLSLLTERDLLRREEVFDSAAGPRVEIGGRVYRMFASNNYLGLAGDPRLAAAACEAVERFGAGTGGSRLTTGTQTLHKQLERALAAFKNTEDAVLFNTGYAANSGAIPALCGKSDTIFSDELNHASIIDGCRLSGARIVIYRHNDMRDLASKVADAGGGARLIVSDAVFSMDGDIAPLPELLAIAEKYDCWTMIDEAHATGVLGRTGRGIMEHFGLTGPGPDLLMGTLSKALGAEGGFVCCSREMAGFLRNRARSYIFSTAMPAGTVAAALAALRIVEAEPWRTAALRRNVERLLEELEKGGIAAASDSAIVPVIVGDSRTALERAAALREAGFIVSPIRYPSVAENAARLRITLMATHTEADILPLGRALASVCRGGLVGPP